MTRPRAPYGLRGVQDFIEVEERKEKRREQLIAAAQEKRVARVLDCIAALYGDGKQFTTGDVARQCRRRSRKRNELRLALSKALHGGELDAKHVGRWFGSLWDHEQEKYPDFLGPDPEARTRPLRFLAWELRKERDRQNNLWAYRIVPGPPEPAEPEKPSPEDRARVLAEMEQPQRPTVRVVEVPPLVIQVQAPRPVDPVERGRQECIAATRGDARRGPRTEFDVLQPLRESPKPAPVAPSPPVQPEPDDATPRERELLAVFCRADARWTLAILRRVEAGRRSPLTMTMPHSLPPYLNFLPEILKDPKFVIETEGGSSQWPWRPKRWNVFDF